MIRPYAWVIADLFLLLLLVAFRPQPIGITIANSIGKQEWLHQAVEEFNAASLRDANLQVGASPIHVDIVQEMVDGIAQDYRSGSMIADTVNGSIKPTIVSPAGEFWINKLQKEWQDRYNKMVTADTGPALATSPLVIAMWASRAEALGCWPSAQPTCTWARLRALGEAPDGWGMVGHPEWGALKLGYAYMPDNSPTTAATSLVCMVGAGKTAGLAVSDVTSDSGCGRTIAAIESVKMHSGTTVIALLQTMAVKGPRYLDGVFIYESDVVGFNLALPEPLSDPIVSVYPQDGTILAGHTFTVLDGAPWVSPPQATAAQVFQRFLLSNEQQRKLLATGLRPVDSSVPVASPIDPAFGADPRANLVTREMPDRLVVDRITEVWQRAKKHAIVALVFDKSRSMAGAKLADAISGAQEFVRSMDRDDSLIWAPFDTSVATPFESPPNRALVDQIAETTAGGETALYDAVLAAYVRLQTERAAYGTSRRYGIVVLSDGKDSASQSTQALLEVAVQAEQADPNGIQIYAIATSADVDETVLRKIAAAGNGTFQRANSSSVLAQVYHAIARYF